MIPPRVPQYNWVDFGLPSGTLWLDRLVGAKSPKEQGLYYQWGAINGHTATDGFSFDADTYREQGLNSISGDLSDEQDAARAYYGHTAKMPSEAQMNELIEHCTPSLVEDEIIKVTSRINGNSILIRGGGLINGSEITQGLRAWSRNLASNDSAIALHGSDSSLTIRSHSRFLGLNIMAVHS